MAIKIDSITYEQKSPSGNLFTIQKQDGFDGKVAWAVFSGQSTDTNKWYHSFDLKREAVAWVSCQ